MNKTYIPWLCLVGIGISWGLTIPLTKIAVSTGYQHFGLVFWQSIFGAVALALFCRATGKPLRVTKAAMITGGVLAITGTIVPNSLTFIAAKELPAGIMALTISLVPMVSFPIAIAIGADGFNMRRLIGLLAGLAAVLLILVPDTSLPDPSKSIFVLVALGATIFYAFEGNYVAKWGLRGLDPVQALFWASVISASVTLPLALATGQGIDLIIPWRAPEFALLASSLLHAFTYTLYVWLVGRAGPIFSSQVAYFVIGFGVIWSILLLNESYSQWIWAALGLMLLGLFLVNLRKQNT